MSSYKDIEEFYSEQVRVGDNTMRLGNARRHSGELDFGVWWKPMIGNENFRISVVKDTGEVYQVSARTGEVTVLCVLDSPVYDNAERIFENWADHCGREGSLEWVHERAQAAIREALA